MGIIMESLLDFTQVVITMAQQSATMQIPIPKILLLQKDIIQYASVIMKNGNALMVQA